MAAFAAPGVEVNRSAGAAGQAAKALDELASVHGVNIGTFLYPIKGRGYFFVSFF
jgi:hypothetical protein